MKITIDNYFRATQKVDIASLPSNLKKGHEFVIKATNNGEQWSTYDTSEPVKRVIDLQIEKLNEFLETHSSGAKPARTKHSAPRAKSQRTPTTRKPKKPPVKYNHQTLIPDEIKLLRRFVNLHGKQVTPEQILRLINALQKAIVEKRIRKTSQYASHINTMQDKLVKLYNSMGKVESVELTAKLYDELKKLTTIEKVYPSVQYIKRYIGLHGKVGMKEKAKRLLTNLEWAAKRDIVTKADPYKDELNAIYSSLKSFVDTRGAKTLVVDRAELNGLNGIVRECSCDSLDGFDYDEMTHEESSQKRPRVMNSIDFNLMEFDTIGFSGKWYDLIGDPAPGFSAMIFGKPKMGKSYLAVDFAGYLARNHGKVLYVAREERLDSTLQKKLRDKRVEHPNLDVADDLPEDLSGYDFVFIDSVNKSKLDPDQLDALRAENPDTSFIFVFQTTKLGNFRGGNEFQHDVDVVIEVPQFGKAIQFGRFNQGGEIDIFDSNRG